MMDQLTDNVAIEPAEKVDVFKLTEGKEVYCGGTANDYWEVLRQNQHKWQIGANNTAEGLMIGMKPSTREGVVEVEGVFVDTNFVRTNESGETVLKGEDGWKEMVWYDLDGMKSEKGVMFRGMSESEWKSIQETGVMRSNGKVVEATGEDNSLFFTADAGSAFGYASMGRIFDQPGFGESAYVVEVVRPETVKSETDAEIVIEGEVPSSQIKRVFEIKPYAIKGGTLTLSHNTADDSYSVDVTAERMRGGFAGRHVFRELAIK